MNQEGLRRRSADLVSKNGTLNGSIPGPRSSSPHKPGNSMQALRLAGLFLYFLASCLCLHFQQFLGVPLYWYNKDWYYAWQALAKQMFGLLLVTMQDWWCPMHVRITGDKSVQGQIKQLADGKVQLDFPERVVLISNHQIYTDWIFMWWTAFTTKMHGHFFIILKESLKFVPILGPGMMFFSFIFLSRQWEADQPRLRHRMRKLKSAHGGPLSGTGDLDPMWLLIFPEGTTLSTNGRNASKKWAEKTGIPDLKHALLPRTRGLQLCLQELEGTVEWIYDCTVAYNGIPPGEYGQDFFTLRRTYLEGRGPPYCNMHWRRFLASEIPIRDETAFDKWLHDRWVEKDDLLEYFTVKGRFPCDEEAVVRAVNGESKATTNGSSTVKTTTSKASGEAEPIYGYVGPNGPLEFIQIFASILAVPIVWKMVGFIWATLRIVLLIASLGQVRI